MGIFASGKAVGDEYSDALANRERTSLGGSSRGAQLQGEAARQMALAANDRDYKPDIGEFTDYGRGRIAAQESRGQQLQALDMARSAAQGRAPSAANLAANLGSDQALQQQLAAGAQGRGYGAARGAQLQGAEALQGAALGGARGMAGEGAANRALYSGLSGQIRSGDLAQGQQSLGAQELVTGSQAKQRAINAQREQDYGRLGYDTDLAQMRAAQATRDIGLQEWTEAAMRHRKQKDNVGAQAAQVAAVGASVAGSYLASDARSKERIASLEAENMRLRSREAPIVAETAGDVGPRAIVLPEQGDPRKRGPYMPPERAASLSRAGDEMGRSFEAMGASDSYVNPDAGGTRAMAREARPVAFEYKPGHGEDPGPRRFGVLAQDLERTPAGRSLVVDTPKGKAIDTRQATGTLLATVADQQRQLDALRAKVSPEDRALEHAEDIKQALEERAAVDGGGSFGPRTLEGYRNREGAGALFASGGSYAGGDDERMGLAPGTLDYRRSLPRKGAR